MCSKEYLYEEYIVKNRSLENISKDFFVNRQTIANWAKKLGIKVKDPSFELNKNLVGKMFGNWKVLSEIRDKNTTSRILLCECICGLTRRTRASNIVNGANFGCGCIYKYKDINLAYLTCVKASAKRRGLDYDLNPEYLWNLFVKQNKKCIYTGDELIFSKRSTRQQTASLDRIDSSKGYIEGNVQWIHKDINIMKNDWDHKEFLNIIYKISEYQIGGSVAALPGESMQS